MVRSVWRRVVARPFFIAAAAVAVVAVVMALPGGAAADPAPRVRLVYESEANPPRTLGDGTATDWGKPGLTLELLRLVAARAGVEFAFERVPWRRGLYLVETNEADGLFHVSFLPERMGAMAYPMRTGRPDAARAIFVQSYMLYKRAGSPVAWDGATLTGAEGPVGATFGYSVLSDLRRLGVPFEEAKTMEQSLDKLAGGRISAYAGLEGMADAVLAANPAKYGTLVKMTPPLVSKPYHLVFSRAFYAMHRDLAERIWDAIAEVNASDEFAAIVRRYGD